MNCNIERKIQNESTRKYVSHNTDYNMFNRLPMQLLIVSRNRLGLIILLTLCIFRRMFRASNVFDSISRLTVLERYKKCSLILRSIFSIKSMLKRVCYSMLISLFDSWYICCRLYRSLSLSEPLFCHRQYFS